MNPAKQRSLGIGLPTSERWSNGDDYPGGPPASPPPSRFDGSGKCTYCGHTRGQHGKDKCGFNPAPELHSISCRCPFGSDSK